MFQKFDLTIVDKADLFIRKFGASFRLEKQLTVLQGLINLKTRPVLFCSATFSKLEERVLIDFSTAHNQIGLPTKACWKLCKDRRSIQTLPLQKWKVISSNHFRLSSKERCKIQFLSSLRRMKGSLLIKSERLQQAWNLSPSYWKRRWFAQRHELGCERVERSLHRWQEFRSRYRLQVLEGSHSFDYSERRHLNQSARCYPNGRQRKSLARKFYCYSDANPSVEKCKCTH